MARTLRCCRPPFLQAVLAPWLSTGAGRLAGMILAMLVTTTPATSAREFRVADNQVESYPTVQALIYMGRLVAERTGGRHTMQVFHSRQLGEEEQTIDQTRAGAIDFARVNIALMTRHVPVTAVLALPFLFHSIDHLHAVLDGPIGSEILDSFTANGLVGLTFYDSGARSLYNSVRPIRSLADVKGLRIRVQASAIMADMIGALGAEAIELPYGQVLTGLTTKLIDGAENNWPSFVTTGHYKAARYYTLTEHTMTPEVLVMSALAWNALSDADQRIFRDAARESNIYMRSIWTALEERSRRDAQAAGIIVIKDFDRRPFEQAMSDIYAKAARDPTVARLIDRIRGVP
jgi:tripartite ATP-independent transporter DctP family solute receptor